MNMEKERSGNLKTRLRNAERFPCTAPSINMEQHCELMDFLPKGYQYHVCRYRAVSQSNSDHLSFECTVRMSLQSKEEILVWLKSMEVTWRVAYTRPAKGQRIIFKAEYRCQYNTKPRETALKAGGLSKNTDCPAKLKVTLVRTRVSHGQRSRSTDPHIPHYPTLVEISNIHNHNTHVAGAVQRVRRHSPSTVLSKSSAAPCEHQAGVTKAISSDVFLPVNSSMTTRLLQITTGNELTYENSVKDSLEVSDGSQLTPQESYHCSEISMTSAEESEDAEVPEAVLDIEEWHSMINELSALVTSNEGLQGAAAAMIKTFHRLKGNPSGLRSAMHMFGCYSADCPASQQTPALRQKIITSQHTSVDLKTANIRVRSLTAGKPTDHHYSNPKGSRAGTHSLSQNDEHHYNP